MSADINNHAIAYIKEDPQGKGETAIAFDEAEFKEIMQSLSKDVEAWQGGKTYKGYIERSMEKYGQYLANLTIRLGKVNPQDAKILVDDINRKLTHAFVEYASLEKDSEIKLHAAIDLQSPALAERIKSIRNNNQSFGDKIRGMVGGMVQGTPAGNYVKYASGSLHKMDNY